MNVATQALEYTPTLLHRIQRRLFPVRWCELPNAAIEGDGLRIETTVELSMADRIRALLTGRLRFCSKTATEHYVGKNETVASFHVLPPKWME